MVSPRGRPDRVRQARVHRGRALRGRRRVHIKPCDWPDEHEQRLACGARGCPAHVCRARIRRVRRCAPPLAARWPWPKLVALTPRRWHQKQRPQRLWLRRCLGVRGCGGIRCCGRGIEGSPWRSRSSWWNRFLFLLRSGSLLPLPRTKSMRRALRTELCSRTRWNRHHVTKTVSVRWKLKKQPGARLPPTALRQYVPGRRRRTPSTQLLSGLGLGASRQEPWAIQ